MNNLARAIPPEAPLEDRLPDGVVAAAPEVLRANVESACRRGLPQIPRLSRNSSELMICAGGPSLKRALPEIKRRLNSGAHIIAINKASEFLLENGIGGGKIAVVLADPQDFLVAQFAADKRVSYLVASQCHPAVFDKLAGHEVMIWHCQCDDEKSWILPFYPDPVLVPSGTTAALRSIDIGYILGFRKVHYYGLDGSFERGDDGNLAHHAYAQDEDDLSGVIEIIARDSDGERRFLTRSDYARQANEFMRILKTYDTLWKMGKADRFRVYVHGDGLIPHIWRKRRHELG